MIGEPVNEDRHGVQNAVAMCETLTRVAAFLKQTTLPGKQDFKADATLSTQDMWVNTLGYRFGSNPHGCHIPL